MTAKLAMVDDFILVHGEEARVLGEANSTAGTGRNQTEGGEMQFDCGYLSPYFITDPERMEVAFDNVYVLICEEKISSKRDLLPLLEQIAKSGKPLLIVALDVGGEALAALVVKKLRGSLQVAAVRAPGFGSQRKRMLQDIALLTGGKAITEGLGVELRNIQISDLGQARKITVDKNHTTVEGRARCEQLSFDRALCVQSVGSTSIV